MFKHMREELEDAKQKGWREEARLVARNCIIAGAASCVPLAIVMGVTAMLIWDATGSTPPLISNTAIFYPLSVVGGVGGAMLLFNRDAFTGAMLLAVAPFLCVFVFLAGVVLWIFGG